MKWFKEKEFACRCCGELPPLAQANVRALVENVLDPVREKLGQPIVVNSGYRCREHNLKVGGVKGSQHLVGEAADICPSTGSGTDLEKLKQLIVENGKFDQLITYPTFLHVSYKRNGGNRHQRLKKGGQRYELD